jgi:hypothetical protein
MGAEKADYIKQPRTNRQPSRIVAKYEWGGWDGEEKGESDEASVPK